VNETCGIKIEPINLEYYISELKKALLSLLTDEKRRQELGKNGRKRVIEEFSPQALEKKIGSLYDSIFDTSLNAVN
jgi:glycosyltransferase involved in cell wall biosynthesis